MNARKKSKQSSIASEEGKRKWPAAWGEPSKEERELVPPPKWKIWIATRCVSLENAILLSLGYDPTFFRGESISHLLDNDPVKGRFQERIDILEECHAETKILLSDFASMAVTEFNWEGLPDELVALAQKTSVAPVAHEKIVDSETPQDRAQRRAEAASNTRGAMRLILENWDAILKLHGPKANGRHVLRWMKNEKACDKLPKIKTIQNRLSELKADNLIP